MITLYKLLLRSLDMEVIWIDRKIIIQRTLHMYTHIAGYEHKSNPNDLPCRNVVAESIATSLAASLGRPLDSNIPVEHPDVPIFFGGFDGDSYEILENSKN